MNKAGNLGKAGKATLLIENPRWEHAVSLEGYVCRARSAREQRRRAKGSEAALWRLCASRPIILCLNFRLNHAGAGRSSPCAGVCPPFFVSMRLSVTGPRFGRLRVRPRLHRGAFILGAVLLVGGGVASAMAQAFRPDRPNACAPWQAEGPPREFHFTRGIYSSGGGGGMGGFFGGGGFGRGARAWCTDHPKAEEQFLEVLDRLTGIDAHPYGNAIRLDDPELRRHPILYMLEVGYMGMTNAEVEGLRGHLLAGGFLIIDDFWGTREWQNFEREMARVLPEYEIVELSMDHPVYRTYYQVDTVYQVPAFRANGNYARTWEQDGFEARNFGIFDESGRLMVAINWNTDLGDAWEWMEQPTYPLRFSTYAYQVGVNYIIHAMSN